MAATSKSRSKSSAENSSFSRRRRVSSSSSSSGSEVDKATFFHEVVANPVFYLKAFGLFVSVFVSLAATGAVVQVVKQGDDAMAISSRLNLDSEVVEGDDVNWKVAAEAMGLALNATWIALKLWFRLIMSIVLPTSKRSWIITTEGWTALQPSIRQAVIWFLNSDPLTKVIVFSVIGLLVLVWTLEREIRRRKYVERIYARVNQVYSSYESRYRGFRKQVSHQSRVAAQVLPHVLFCAIFAAVYVAFPDLMYNLASGFYGWSVVVGFPCVASTRALLVYEALHREKVERRKTRKRRAQSGLPEDDPASLVNAQGAVGYVRSFWTNLRNRATKTMNDRTQEERELSLLSSSSMDPDHVIRQFYDLRTVLKWLRYWTVMGVALLVEQLPLTGHMISLVPMWPVVRFSYALWLQIPGTRGSDIAFQFSVPLISKYFLKVKAPDARQSQSMVLNLLFGMGFINVSVRNQLVEVFDTGGTLIMMSLPFFFTPAFITSIGNLLVGLGYPIYSGVNALMSAEASYLDAKELKRVLGGGEPSEKDVKRPRGRSKQQQSSRVSGAVDIFVSSQQCNQWLEYWVVYSVLVMVFSYVSWTIGWFIPFWTHGLLLGTMWLQLPYFRGAHAMFKVVNDMLYQWKKRKGHDEDVIEEEVYGTESQLEWEDRYYHEENSDVGDFGSEGEDGHDGEDNDDEEEPVRLVRRRSSKRRSTIKKDESMQVEQAPVSWLSTLLPVVGGRSATASEIVKVKSSNPRFHEDLAVDEDGDVVMQSADDDDEEEVGQSVPEDGHTEGDNGQREALDATSDEESESEPDETSPKGREDGRDLSIKEANGSQQRRGMLSMFSSRRKSSQVSL